MQWTIDDLMRDAQEPMFIDPEVEVTSLLKSRDDEIMDASNARVQGMLLYEEGTVLFQATVAISVTLPSTRSLAPVDVPLTFAINERYFFPQSQTDIKDDESVVAISLEDDTLSLDDILVDNILTHLPMVRLTTEEEQTGDMPEGHSWQAMTEDNYHHRKSEEVDPRFAVLKDYFSSDDANDEDN